MTLKIGLVGLGTIARNQHLPAINAHPALDLVGIASRNATLPGVPSYDTIDDLLAAEPALDIISLCTPPQGRFNQAMTALGAGKHLMLEKPPGMTLSEMVLLRTAAETAELTLFSTWHSREAASIDAARDWLQARELESIHVTWHENVHKWHPGQEWIWEPGGLGVFDPGINALSILTAILPAPPRLIAAEMRVPEGRHTPITATLELRLGRAPIHADFDWSVTGDEVWCIEIAAGGERARLDRGGAELRIGDQVSVAEGDQEYPRLYARMHDLVCAGESALDVTPLSLVADAFLIARRHSTTPFDSIRTYSAPIG